jgi:hypothetical protein
VADKARREVKLLAKPTKLALDPFGKTHVELKQPFPKELGEYAVVVIATPTTSVQFTIAHPIGITDLDSSTWVAHRSDQLQGMLARAKDPNQANLDQSRTATRQRMAVQNGLLKEDSTTGKKKFFYPHRNDMDRNTLLEEARGHSREAVTKLKQQIADLKDNEKHLKQGLLNQIQSVEDPLHFMDVKTSEAEKKLREYYSSKPVLEEVLKENPQSYRTLSGPYFTIPQVAMPESKDKRLEDVAIRFARNLAIGSTGVAKSKLDPAATSYAAADTAVANASPPAVAKPQPPGGPPPAQSNSGAEEEEVIDPKTGKKTLRSRITNLVGM